MLFRSCRSAWRCRTPPTPAAPAGGAPPASGACGFRGGLVGGNLGFVCNRLGRRFGLVRRGLLVWGLRDDVSLGRLRLGCVSLRRFHLGCLRDGVSLGRFRVGCFRLGCFRAGDSRRLLNLGADVLRRRGAELDEQLRLALVDRLDERDEPQDLVDRTLGFDLSQIGRAPRLNSSHIQKSRMPSSA